MSIKTFEDYTKENLINLTTKNTLHELSSGPLIWISDIIIKYNELGFLTYTSQPGSCFKTIIYKTMYDRKFNISENILSIDGKRLQRVYIRGYMHKDMASYIVEKLIKDKYLFARSENLNNIIPNIDIKLGSVNFYKDDPVITKMSHNNDLKSEPDGNESFNLNQSLHRPFNFIYYSSIDDIVEFDIVDVRWNNNTYLWEKLLELIIASNSKVD